MHLSNYLNNFRQIETPFYFYDLDLLRSTIGELKKCIADTNFHVHYAMKANVNDTILKLIKDSGLGADCVSGNEVKKAIEIGFTPEEIAFAGVGKTDKEINYALDQKIFAFNCESFEEIKVINELAIAKNTKASIAIRINPNVDAQTHKHITTGLSENKFGINIPDLENLIQDIKKFEAVDIKGIHFHIGSQIMNLDNYKALCLKVNDLIGFFHEQGVDLEHVNVGGGLGIDYNDPENNLIPTFEKYFNLFKEHLKVPENIEVHFELGRSIVGQCGTLISKVLYIKEGINTNFMILDAGMTEMMRTALYQAQHKILSFSRSNETATYDVVGPICESTDAFGRKIQLPKSKRGDLIALLSTGAYGETMANRYNMRNIVQAVYSDELVVPDFG